MRKVILISLLAGTCVASAVRNVAPGVTSGVGADVANVCVYQANGEDIRTNGYTRPNVIALGEYRANKDIALQPFDIVNVQCNRGTILTTSFDPDDLQLSRTSGTGAPLLATVAWRTTRTSSSTGQMDPDTYRVRAYIGIEKGQWGVKSGNYQGTATVTLTYN